MKKPSKVRSSLVYSLIGVVMVVGSMFGVKQWRANDTFVIKQQGMVITLSKSKTCENPLILSLSDELGLEPQYKNHFKKGHVKSDQMESALCYITKDNVPLSKDTDAIFVIDAEGGAGTLHIEKK